MDSFGCCNENNGSGFLKKNTKPWLSADFTVELQHRRLYSGQRRRPRYQWPAVERGRQCPACTDSGLSSGECIQPIVHRLPFGRQCAAGTATRCRQQFYQSRWRPQPASFFIPARGAWQSGPELSDPQAGRHSVDGRTNAVRWASGAAVHNSFRPTVDY